MPNSMIGFFNCWNQPSCQFVLLEMSCESDVCPCKNSFLEREDFFFLLMLKRNMLLAEAMIKRDIQVYFP
jgi:hypothetical protein